MRVGLVLGRLLDRVDDEHVYEASARLQFESELFLNCREQREFRWRHLRLPSTVLGSMGVRWTSRAGVRRR
jgi:hypothetical protein